MGDNLNGIFANMIQGMGFIGCAPNRVYNMAPPDGGGVEATAEGTELTLHSAAAPLTALTLYGKSEQRTTTGAQLMDINTMIYNGAFARTTINDSNIARTAVIPIEPGVEYSISRGNLEGNFFRVIQTSFNKDVIKLTDITVDTFIDDTFFEYSSFSECTIIANNNAKYLLIYFWSNVSEYTLEDVLSVLMVNAGTTALPWEPYTGGQPSPSPGYPQEIKSVGDSGTINVTISDGGSQSQTLPIQTPNGLPGIPVDSGGNYTDASGQQWVCDEVDFERGVYVQRVSQVEFDGSPDENWTISNHNGGGEKQGLINFRITKPDKRIPNYWIRYNGLLCNMFKGSNGSNVAWEYSFGEGITTDANDIFCVANRSFVASIDEWKNHLTTYPLKLMYPVATPVETPLSPSDIAAYSALRTYSPTTVVSNDAGAWMNVGYKATPQPMTMLARKR